jgi:UTP---glucose-1-phosphate uridylyltransferase
MDTIQRKKSGQQSLISHLELVLNRIGMNESLEGRIKILYGDPDVKQFLRQNSKLTSLLNKLDNLKKYIVLSLLVIGQGPVIFQNFENLKNADILFDKLLEDLTGVEKFYNTIGGIIGYHLSFLKLISNRQNPIPERKQEDTYLHPEGWKLNHPTQDTQNAIRWGIESLAEMAEIYPVGGAGDRLNLTDGETGEPLPAAELPFGGRTLLEGMIRDLQGREYLYYKLFHKQLITPIAMMTSYEKNNHNLVLKICESQKWFGRSKENFKFFIQPLVPLVTKEGNWAVSSTMKLLWKPGGHGVIWKLASDNKIFHWFKEKNRSKGLVRQINNPIAGTDYGLTAFSGIGCKNDKGFGFASCPRRLNTSEGMNVLIEKKNSNNGYTYCLTNLEYTDFELKGVKDIPAKPGSEYSVFPANTNILFIDFELVQQTLKKHPIPGMLINMKTKVECLDSNGHLVTIEAGRLESTMQNLADAIVDCYDHPLKEGERNSLTSFLTYNERRKTISVTKKSFYKGSSILETPEGCFYEMMQNYHELLENHCQFQMPEKESEEAFLSTQPPFVAFFHPALGGIYDIISQKIRKGIIEKGAEIFLEIADIDIQNLHLKGSLRIIAKNIMGSENGEGKIIFGKDTGKCTLRNVTITNQGIDAQKKNQYWKNEISRKEQVFIELEGNAEFFAEDLHIKGEFHIHVPNGYRAIAIQRSEEIHVDMEKISSATWEWEYSFSDKSKIQLKRGGYEAGWGCITR